MFCRVIQELIFILFCFFYLENHPVVVVLEALCTRISRGHVVFSAMYSWLHRLCESDIVALAQLSVTDTNVTGAWENAVKVRLTGS